MKQQGGALRPTKEEVMRELGILEGQIIADYSRNRHRGIHIQRKRKKQSE